MYKICEICKKVPATVHLTDIKNNVKTEIHMCESCAAQKGINIKKPLSLQELFAKKIADVAHNLHKKTDREHTDRACPHCGLTWEGFRENGRLGCPRDYETFAEELRPLLDDFHAMPGRHAGKRPRPNPHSEQQRRRQEYQRRLREAVACEDYLEAARLRDSIQALEKEI